MPARFEKLQLRAELIRSAREFFLYKGFLEIETPLRIPANAPEEHIDPYRSEEFFLQTSPEMCMKRLLSRGYSRIFQISRCWRRAERGSRHLPEFTMLEWYRSNSSYLDLMNDCDELLAWLADRFEAQAGLMFRGNTIHPSRKACRITVDEAFRRYTGKEMRQAVADDSFDICMVEEIEPSLPFDQPVMLLDYPAEMAALARLKAKDRTVAERFELYLGGLELANGFSELNDSQEQRSRFIEANLRREKNGLPQLPLPEPFLNELASMPASAGIALGIDRLVMLFTNAESIDQVVAFTPEEL